MPAPTPRLRVVRAGLSSPRSCTANHLISYFIFPRSARLILRFFPPAILRVLSRAPFCVYRRFSTPVYFIRTRDSSAKLFRAGVLTRGAFLHIIYPLHPGSPFRSANRIRGSAGIGRQARLRGVCCMTYRFKSHLPHHLRNQAIARFLFIFLSIV